jgi:hypothetical protein
MLCRRCGGGCSVISGELGRSDSGGCRGAILNSHARTGRQSRRDRNAMRIAMSAICVLSVSGRLSCLGLLALGLARRRLRCTLIFHCSRAVGSSYRCLGLIFFRRWRWRGIGRWCGVVVVMRVISHCRYAAEHGTERDKNDFMDIHHGSPLLNASRLQSEVIKYVFELTV